MIKPRIIVTGSTGKTGSVVVTELLRAFFNYPITRLPDYSILGDGDTAFATT